MDYFNTKNLYTRYIFNDYKILFDLLQKKKEKFV